jgi:site-specific DNA recombinase
MSRQKNTDSAVRKAIGYVRVSTTEQAEEGVSLDAQREKIKAYAALHGLELVTIWADEGLSGSRADNRPGLQKALDQVCKQKAILVVYSLSRLARSTRDCITMSDRLGRAGADLASITEKIDTTSSMGRFFFTLMAALAQLERDQISERTTSGMGHLRKLGRRISCHVPYGFDVAGGVKVKDGGDGEKLQPNAAEQATIESMGKQRGKGRTFQQIADHLNANSVPSKSGGKWYASAVRSVLGRLRSGAT